MRRGAPDAAVSTLTPLMLCAMEMYLPLVMLVGWI